MGKLLNDARVNNGLTASDNSVLYLILDLFGLGIVDYALMQNTIYKTIFHPLIHMFFGRH